MARDKVVHDEIIEEIQHDIRQEALLKIWKDYGNYIIAGILVALTVAGSWNMWSNYRHKRDTQIALEFATAHMMASSGKSSAAIDLFEKISKSSHSAYALFSKLYKARLTYDPTLTVTQYEEIIADQSLEEQWRDLAFLFQTYIVFDQAKNDEDLRGRLEGIERILKKTHCPWKLLLLEIKAGILFGLGDYTKSAETFASIAKDSSAPKGLLMRAAMMSKLSLSKMKLSKGVSKS